MGRTITFSLKFYLKEITFTWYGFAALTVTTSPAMWPNNDFANGQLSEIFPSNGLLSTVPTIEYVLSSFVDKSRIVTVEPTEIVLDKVFSIISQLAKLFWISLILALTSACFCLAAS